MSSPSGSATSGRMDSLTTYRVPPLPAYAVDHYAAVQHVDVLAERLDKVLSDLKAL